VIATYFSVAVIRFNYQKTVRQMRVQEITSYLVPLGIPCTAIILLFELQTIYKAVENNSTIVSTYYVDLRTILPLPTHLTTLAWL